MSKATKQQTKSAKAILELNTKLIDCHEHPGAHSAVLYCFGHAWAGIWECPFTGMSDAHEHDDYEIVSTYTSFNDPSKSDGYGEFESEVYICGGINGCGVTIKDESPALDRQENEDE